VKILIVEDDPAQAETLAKLLKRAAGEMHVSIEQAGTLREGLEKSWASRVDVTYLDLSLPDVKDFHETIRAIKDFYPPVIVITGMDDADGAIKLECFTYGAQNFFLKPKDIKLLAPHLLSTGAAAHLRREAPKRLEADLAPSDEPIR
jgi:DNA-binding response OmpR family regulator